MILLGGEGVTKKITKDQWGRKSDQKITEDHNYREMGGKIGQPGDDHQGNNFSQDQL